MHVDAYAPREIARRAEKIGATKARQDAWTTMALAFLAGAFIALGAQFYTVVIHDSPFGFGLTQLVGGMAFTLGLVLVVVAGAELFTGNTLIVMAFAQGKITWQDLLRNWALVYVGNFLGALAIVLLVYATRQFAMNEGLVGARAILIAHTKVNYPFFVALSRGILCNALVTLAVWLSISGRHVVDKVVAMLFPITAFVASGFEHSVANMYFIPIALLLKGQAPLLALASRAGETVINPATLSVAGLFRNLIPVTLGNIIGGVLFVGLAYWFIYLRQPGALRLPRLFPGVPPLVRPARKPARRGNKRDEDS
ncbi:MAG: formate/nitrite transporter family protein [Clostridia bacterium]|nr:formate/nitrite transporter family protein [Clostridia bacterium]